MTDIFIEGGRALLGSEIRRNLVADRGAARSVAVGSDHGRGSLGIDAGGLMVLPGIVDLHGDAFERQMMPRPGVDFPIDVALIDSDRQAISNGITTVYHATTWSWEPGLRSARQCAEIAGGDRGDAAAACGRHPLPSAPRDLQSRCRKRESSSGCRKDASTCSRSTTTWTRRSPDLAKPQKRSRMVERTGPYQ